MLLKKYSIESTGELIKNKIAEKIVKSKPMTDANLRNV